jgi:ankyrin repeat domain-containing protein 50
VYTRCNNGKQAAAIRDLMVVFSAFAATEQLDDIYIVVDALDECPTSKGERKELLELIRDIIALSPSKIHLLVTSRPEFDIKEMLSSSPTVSPLSIQNTEIKADIKKYIAHQLATDLKLKGWSSDVKLLIEDHLTKKANGM